MKAPTYKERGYDMLSGWSYHTPQRDVRSNGGMTWQGRSEETKQLSPIITLFSTNNNI
jgi:hypothetical protein